MIYFSPEGVGRQIRRVGLDKHSVVGNDERYLLDLSGVLEGYHARKRDIPAALYQLLGHLRTAAVAVEDSLDAGVLKYSLKAVSVSLSVVYHNGNIKFLSHQKLSLKAFCLKSLVKGRPIVVKTYLAERDYLVLFPFFKHLAKCRELALKSERTSLDILGVNTCRDVHFLKASCLLYTKSACFRTSTYIYDAADLTRKKLLKQSLGALGVFLAVKSRIVVMSVRVEEARLLRLTNAVFILHSLILFSRREVYLQRGIPLLPAPRPMRVSYPRMQFRKELRA